MKKLILIIVALPLAQSAFAMEPLPSHAEDANVTLAQVASLDYQLYRAAEGGDYNKVAKLLKAGADVNATGDYANSALAVAAENGHEEIVKLLLENHALVDAREAGGTTPLMWASTADIVELLLRAGADINAIDREGRAALHHAAKGSNSEVIQTLLENGAHIDAENNHGFNPVGVAASLGNEELVLQLLTTPNRKMIIRALAGIKAIQKSQSPSRDVLWLLKQSLISKLVEDQMNRIAPIITKPYGANGMTVSDFASMASNPDLSTLLDPNNPASVARIRQLVEENISRFIFGEPRQQLEPAQGLSQEEVDDIMGRWER